MGTFKVWWIPQIPMEAFEVDVESVAEGFRLCDILAEYDLFQFENRVKPDYSNVGGVQELENGEWWDIDREDWEYEKGQADG